MNKRALVLTTLVMVVLLLATSSVVSADPNGPINCLVTMDWNGAFWAGTVDGCTLEGLIRFDPDPANPSYVVGNSLHFFETFTIELASGDQINGTTAGFGQVDNPPFQFLANGWITNATGPWTYLIGNKYFESGLAVPTTNIDLPLHVKDMTMRIVPAQTP